MEDLKYLITTQYIDQEKWQRDSQKGWEVLEELRSKYLPEFKKMLYYENQFDFWDEVLGVNYLYYALEYTEGNMLINLYEFELTAPESDWQQLNEWLLEKTSEYISKRLKEVGKDEYQKRYLKTKFVSFDALKSDFELRFSEAVNHPELIKNELASFDKKIGALVLPEVYNDYLKYRIVPDYTKIAPQLYYLLRIHNSFQYALYREYLQTELDRSDKKQNPSFAIVTKGEPLTNAQIALILHYTGVIENLMNSQYDKTVIARIIGAMTGIGYKGIYTPICKIHQDTLKTKENLTAIQKRLKEYNLKEFMPVVERDYQAAKS